MSKRTRVLQSQLLTCSVFISSIRLSVFTPSATCKLINPKQTCLSSKKMRSTVPTFLHYYLCYTNSQPFPIISSKPYRQLIHTLHIIKVWDRSTRFSHWPRILTGPGGNPADQVTKPISPQMKDESSRWSIPLQEPTLSVLSDPIPTVVICSLKTWYKTVPVVYL